MANDAHLEMIAHLAKMLDEMGVNPDELESRLGRQQMPDELKRYELVDPANNHDKFWQYQRDGNNVFITYGRRGTSGATQIKQFSSLWEAQQFIGRIVAEKTGKGYREVRMPHSGSITVPPVPESDIPTTRRVSTRPRPPAEPPEEPRTPAKKDKADEASVLAHGRARRTLG